jgi:hypothetical protein
MPGRLIALAVLVLCTASLIPCAAFLRKADPGKHGCNG